MKKQILTFIIGALVGAIIATGVFFIIKGNSNDSNQGQMREFKGERPDMQNGEMPEMPNGENAEGNFKGKGQRGNQNTDQTQTKENTNESDASSQSSNT